MSLFLSLECSTKEGSVVIAEENKKNLNCICFRKWSHKAQLSEHTHSHRLPLEIVKALKQTNKKLSDLKFLAVGSGPGRWTGVRTALSVTRGLSFALKLPVYPVNSLRICAEPFLSTEPVFTAFNGFKNQVYFAEFHSLDNQDKNIQLLNFQDWQDDMKNKKAVSSGKKIICLSDLEDFYCLSDDIKTNFNFKKTYPHALSLEKIVYRKKNKRQKKYWQQLKAFYLRSI